MKALNRKEALVNAKANGTLNSFKPLTREEAFTKKALELGGGDVAWEDIKNRPFGEIIEAITLDYSQPDVEHIIEGCGAFNVGETVTITIDGVKHSLVAFDDGYATIGDKYTDLAGGTGELGWLVYTNSDGEVYFLSNQPHTVEIISKVVKTLDPKYLPEGVGSEKFIINFAFVENGNLTMDKTWEDIVNAWENDMTIEGRLDVEDCIEIYYLATFGADGVSLSSITGAQRDAIYGGYIFVANDLETGEISISKEFFTIVSKEATN